MCLKACLNVSNWSKVSKIRIYTQEKVKECVEDLLIQLIYHVLYMYFSFTTSKNKDYVRYQRVSPTRVRPSVRPLHFQRTDRLEIRTKFE